MSFNDRYGLTQAVLEGRKTITRRIMNPQLTGEPKCTSDEMESNRKGWGTRVHFTSGGEAKSHYFVGEIVAVAQSYETVFYDEHCGLPIDDDPQCSGSGLKNKMFAKAEYMPHQIRITSVRVEQLQDISDEDCMREGISVLKANEVGKALGFNINYEISGHFPVFDSPREAYAALIDKVSGNGTWARNPWVFVYEFELVK